jgi:hypothetical protein
VRHSTSFVALIASVIALVACGRSAEDDVADAIRGYSSALGERQFGNACAHVTPAGKADLTRTAKELKLEASNCETALRELLREQPAWERENLKRDSVEDVQVKGERASGHLTGIPLLRLTKIGGEWKIANPFYD